MGDPRYSRAAEASTGIIQPRQALQLSGLNASVASGSGRTTQGATKFETPKYQQAASPWQDYAQAQDNAYGNPSYYPSQDVPAQKEKSGFEGSHSEMPLQSQHDSKVDWQNLVDWVNQFDDSYCVLVNTLPDDLWDGIVLSHVVGYTVCCEADRQMIFDLVNYPGAEGVLGPEQARENFDLAYNVLKCSQTYQDN